MNKSHNDFFLPRPKLSWRAWLIRGATFLVAAYISARFLWIDYSIILNVGDRSDALLRITPSVFVNTCIQLLVLIPCWRTWMLRRWACFLLPVMLFLISLFIEGLSIWSFFGLILLEGFLLGIASGEWPNLKSGF
jgi:hypothetical protein